ncbi:MAG: hypothetical protein GY862_00475 [Gammaproteobacteria bacterium]|nr:hypothetical protein [Gammaproteobacteria bacterium]
MNMKTLNNISVPDSLFLKHLPVSAGRSSQAALLSNAHETVELLYLSSALAERLRFGKHA